MKKPNFFIVGAPKCGTTALYSYLEEHPDIFIPDTSDTLETVFGGKKELHFFGQDLQFGRPTLERYLEYYDAVQNETAIGESSVFYLYSKTAAPEIKDFNPEAKIIIMLRNPVDLMYSWHSQLVFWGDEDLENFEDAVAAEGDRRQGRRHPQRHDHPIDCFFYRDIATFTPQVQRYVEVFGRDNVHIIIFDDFKKDIGHVYRSTLQFLGVDDQFSPGFEVVNSNKSTRSKALQNFVRRPPSFARNLGKVLMPEAVRTGLKTKLLQFNIQHKSRDPLPPELRQQLLRLCVADIEQLSALLGRDLTHWTQEALQQTPV